MKNLILITCLLSFLLFGINTQVHAQKGNMSNEVQESNQSASSLTYIELTQINSVKGGESTIHLTDSEVESGLKELGFRVNSMKSITQAMNYLASQGYHLVTSNAIQLDSNKFTSLYFKK